MVYTTLLRMLFSLACGWLLLVSNSYANTVSFQAVVNASQQAAAADQRIAYGPLPEQYGLLWLPQQTSPAQLVVLVHGGCWLQNYDVSHIHAAAAALRDDGYAVWAPEYRRASAQQSAWPQALNDVVQAIEFIRAGSHPTIAAQQPLLVGHSAGGHLALLASTQTPVQAVVGLAAITDITSYAAGQNGCQQAARWFIGAAPYDSDANALYQQANPRLQTLSTPVRLLASDADSIVPLAQSSYIDTATVVRLTGAGHFDFIYPNSAAWQQLRVTLENISQPPSTDKRR